MFSKFSIFYNFFVQTPRKTAVILLSSCPFLRQDGWRIYGPHLLMQQLKLKYNSQIPKPCLCHKNKSHWEFGVKMAHFDQGITPIAKIEIAIPIPILIQSSWFKSQDMLKNYTCGLVSPTFWCNNSTLNSKIPKSQKNKSYWIFGAKINIEFLFDFILYGYVHIWFIWRVDIHHSIILGSKFKSKNL